MGTKENRRFTVFIPEQQGRRGWSPVPRI